MKNVLFYTDTPNFGGAEKHMLLLAKYLNQKGVKVSLAYGSYSKIKSLNNEFAKVCQKIFVLNALHKHDPRHYLQLKKIFSKYKFDLIHVHLWNPGSCRYAFFAASAAKIPIIATEHDPFELRGMKRLIKKACLAKTWRSIVVSMDSFRLLEESYAYPKNQLDMVHNGIEIDRFLDNQDKADLPVQKGNPVITCIAELHHRKGHRYLIEAFLKLQAHMPLLSLVLVGDGPARHELHEQYRDVPHLHFLGWREDIPQILRASDILVLPSLKEAFGQVILEAMASEVITVATNNGGIPDIIRDGVTGHLVPPASSQALADRITIILKNPDQKRDIEKAALANVQENYTAAKMAENTLTVYNKLK